MAQSYFALLTLFRANPAQVLESRRRTWPEWGGALTEEHYLERVNQMDVMEHATNSKVITWVLAPRGEPDTLDFMCACQTYKRQGLIRYAGSKELQDTTCYGVACVFTPPDKRGKGFASHMMRLLHWVTSGRTAEYNLPDFPTEWGAPPPEVQAAGNGMFSTLYSAVGDNFYKQVGPGLEKAGGWEARGPTISTIWEISQHVETRQKDWEDGWTSLKYGDLNALWEEDVRIIRGTMEDLRESSPTYHTERPTVFVSYLPDRGPGSFHSVPAAESIVSMDIWGVKKNNESTDQPTYASWSVDVKALPPTLVVTRMNATEADFPELLCKIREIARNSGISKMEAWNTPLHLLKVVAETGGKTFEMKKHLPAIKWYGQGQTADIEWVFNQKFCWCY